MQTSALSGVAISVSLSHMFCLVGQQEASLAAAALAQTASFCRVLFSFFNNDGVFVESNSLVWSCYPNTQFSYQ